MEYVFVYIHIIQIAAVVIVIYIQKNFIIDQMYVNNVQVVVFVIN